MLNAWKPWLLCWQPSLMPPTPSAPAPSCRWLDAALRRAGLEALLQANAGLTLLAPTDAALDAAGLVPDRLAPEALQRWLRGHLTPASPQDDRLLPLLDGSLLRRAESGAGWLDAEGRLVHLLGRPQPRPSLRVQAIDSPLAPARQTLWQRVAADPGLARLAGALERCGLHELLDGAAPVTLFAPGDAGLDRAAARLGLGQAGLWQDAGRLRALLLGHIAPGRWSSGELPWPGRLPTLGGGELRLDALGRLRSGDLGLPLARGSDLPCRNGVLHRLSEALLPAMD
ncbi:MAG: fasciclin domain-containing protein [Roseateles sp.]